MKLSSRIQLLLALTVAVAAVFSLISGIGTVCLAFKFSAYPMFPGLKPFVPALQLITIVTLAVGFLLAILAYAFIRGEKWAYYGSLIVLLIGFGFGAWHMYISQTGRGGVAPGNLRVIIDAACIVLLLIVRLPFIWNKLDLTHPLGTHKGSYNNPIGMAFGLIGLGLLSTPLYAGAAHTFGELNLMEVILPELYAIGGIFLALGVTLVVLTKFGFTIERGLAYITKKSSVDKA
jgi:hypothetical protein